MIDDAGDHLKVFGRPESGNATGLVVWVQRSRVWRLGGPLIGEELLARARARDRRPPVAKLGIRLLDFVGHLQRGLVRRLDRRERQPFRIIGVDIDQYGRTGRELLVEHLFRQRVLE